MCVAKYLKENKHNSFYFVRKYARTFVLGHHLFLKTHFFPWHQMFSFLKFCPSTILKENVGIDEKYLFLFIKSKSQTNTKQRKKNFSYFQFSISFYFPFPHSPFPIPDFRNIRFPRMVKQSQFQIEKVQWGQDVTITISNRARQRESVKEPFKLLQLLITGKCQLL